MGFCGGHRETGLVLHKFGRFLSQSALSGSSSPFPKNEGIHVLVRCSFEQYDLEVYTQTDLTVATQHRQWFSLETRAHRLCFSIVVRADVRRGLALDVRSLHIKRGLFRVSLHSCQPSWPRRNLRTDHKYRRGAFDARPPPTLRIRERRERSNSVPERLLMLCMDWRSCFLPALMLFAAYSPRHQ